MDPEQKIAFYERRGFQGTVAVIGLLTAIWALVGAPKPWQVATEISASTVVLSNTEIVLDASAASAKSFDGETKLKAAQRAIGSFVAPLRHEGLALRRAGGTCGEQSEPVVGFDDDHAEAVRKAAEEQQPEGKSNIVEAVRAAVDDFQEPDFKAPDTTNRIVVFINTANQCGSNAVREIHYALMDSGVDFVRIIALRPSRPEVKRLVAFKRGLASVASVEISTPATKPQLKHVVKREVKAAQVAARVVKRKALSASPPKEQGSGGSPSSDTGGGGDQGDETGSSGDNGQRKKLHSNGEEPTPKPKKKKKKGVEPECPAEALSEEPSTGATGSTEAAREPCPAEEPQKKDGATTTTGQSGAATAATGPTGAKQSSATGEPGASTAGS